MSENQRTDRLEERVVDLEKRCALLERHYAPAPKNEVSFTMDAFLSLTETPCYVCDFCAVCSGEEPCKSCSGSWNWRHGDPMPRYFELHEALR